MRRSSPWLRFGICVFFAVLVSGTLWFAKSVETPPWRKQAESTERLLGSDSEFDIPETEVDLPPFSFASYNVKNWLTSSQSPEKSTKAKQAVIRILSGSEPDVIGLCEIGSEDDISEIKLLLKKSGIDLPYSHYSGGVDQVRHLAILSRFPIISTETPDIRIHDTEQSIQRGILDATLSIDEAPVRFIGLHLKSKRIVPQYDQALLRLEESQHVRNHIDRILTKAPSTMLVVYGDFNDHIKSLSTRTLLGTYRTPLYLSPVHAKDSRGENWTHFFDAHDSYSRIDFVTVSNAIKPHVDRISSRILDDPDWNLGSDHRPVFVKFK